MIKISIMEQLNSYLSRQQLYVKSLLLIFILFGLQNTLFSQTSVIAQDNLNSNSVSGGSGWTTNWLTTGSPQFTGGRIFMNGGTNRTARRRVDLSGFDFAKLSILGRCEDSSSGFESGDFVRVDVSTNNGSTYTTLWNRTGNQICPGNDDEENQFISVDLPAGNVNTIIRVRADTDSGSEDYFWDNVVVEGGNNVDTDGDGVNDSDDLDDDNDGITDIEEGCVNVSSFPNAEKGYLFQDGNPENVYLIDIQTGTSSLLTSLSNLAINAVTINEQQQTFWAYEEDQRRIVILDPNTFAVIDQFPVTTANIDEYYVAGAYDPINRYYVAGVRGTGEIEVYDADIDSPTYQDLLFTFSNSNTIPDLVFNTNDGFMYGVESNTSNLIRINVIAQTSTDLGLPSGLNSNDIGSGNIWGAAYSTGDGSLFFGNNQSGRIYEINAVSNSATLFSTGPTSGSNDGAKLLSVGIDGELQCPDLDQDGIVNSLDPDSDGDGCDDVLESGGNDPNGDGILGSLPTTVDNDGQVTGTNTTGGYDGGGDLFLKGNQLVITSDPQDKTIVAGQANETFFVGARVDEATSYSNGAPIYGSPGNDNSTRQYQWFDGDPDNGGVALSNNTTYSGVNSATLTVSNPFNLAPKTFYVVVTSTELPTLCTREVRSAQLLDACDPNTSGNTDSDGDGIADICDLDDDNDGILDIEECPVMTQDVSNETRTIRIRINLDRYEGETSWTLSGPQGPLGNGGSYDPADELIDESFTVDVSGDYEFIIFDSFGDGLSENSTADSDSDNLSNYRIDLDGNPVFVSADAPDFGDQSNHPFFVSAENSFFVTDADAFWTFENTTDDLSGNNHDEQGTPVSAVYSSEAVEGSASLDFDGNYTIQYSDGTFLNAAIDNFSFSAWIRPDNLSGNQVIFDEGGSTNGLTLWLDGSNLTFTTQDNNVISTLVYASPFPTDNDWHHIACTFEAGDMVLYLDGTASPTTTSPYSTIGIHGDPGGLGGVITGSAAEISGNYSGLIDVARYSNSEAWSSADIAAEATLYANCDYDGDGIISSLDLDSDNDGCPDAVEGAANFTEDDLTMDDRLCDNSNCVDSDGIPVFNDVPQGIGVSQDSTSTIGCCIEEPNAGLDGMIGDCEGSLTVIDLFSIITDEDAGGTWQQISGPTSLSVGDGSAVNFNGAAVGNYEFTYTVTAANCPTDISTATVTLEDCCPGAPIVSVGEVICVNGTSYTYNFIITEGASAVSSNGTISGNIVTVGVGTNDVLTVTNSAGCESVILSVVSPNDCLSIPPCVQPTLTIGNSLCDGMTYSVPYSETTGATITTSAGTVGANIITGIPANVDVIVTATNSSNNSCTVSLSGIAPNDCGTNLPPDQCVEEQLSVSGLGICSDDNLTYSVTYVAAAGATVTASAGVIGVNVITDIPEGTSVEILAVNGACSIRDSITVMPPAECCPGAPIASVGEVTCVDGSTYSYSFVITEGSRPVSSNGTINGNTVIGIPVGTNDTLTVGNLGGCEGVIVGVVSPDDCMTIPPCVQPTLTIGNSVCDGMTYSVPYSETTGATISASAGTVGTNVITGIPANVDVIITATNTINSSCTASVIGIAPNDCGPNLPPDQCVEEQLSVSALGICSNDGLSYSVTYTAASGATVTSSVGVIGVNIITDIPLGTSVEVIALNGACSIKDSLTVMSPDCCPEAPIISVGQVECIDGTTYTYNFTATDGAIVESANGTISGNTVSVTVGTEDILTAYFDVNCEAVSLSVVSPATCDNIECEQPDLTIGNSVCAGSTYSVAFTETTGATVTSSAGTVGLNVVTGIPVGSSATITATNPSDGVCVAVLSSVSPADCNEPCVEELVSVSALGVCAEDGDTYSVNFVLTEGASLATNPSVGNIGINIITNIPSGTDLQLIVTNSGCNSVDSILVTAPDCCPEAPIISVGQVECVDGTTYSYTYAATSGSTVTSSNGLVNGNEVTVSVGTNDTLVAYNDLDCSTVAISVISPSTCDNIVCVQQTLTLGNGVCTGTTYSVAFTETSGANVTSNVGTVGSNVITGIPLGTNAIITAINPTDSECETSLTVISPEDCDENCPDELISVSGLGVCSFDAASYTIYYTLSTGSVLSSSPSVGTIGTNSISGIPVGTNITLTITNAACNKTDEISISSPTCLDPCDPAFPGNVDTDGDGIADTCDLDDDNDGILDEDESCDAVPVDFSGQDMRLGENNLPATYSQNASGNPLSSNITVYQPLDESGTTSNGRVWDRGTSFAEDIGFTINNSDSDDAIRTNFSLSGPEIVLFSAGNGSATSLMTDIDRFIISAPPTVSSNFQWLVQSNANCIITISGNDIIITGTVSSTGGPFGEFNITTNEVIDSFSIVYESLGLANQNNTVINISYCSVDTDGDGLINSLDPDSDNDGCPDAIEGAENIDNDQLTTSGVLVGVIDIANEGGIDTDGVPNAVNADGQGQATTTNVTTATQIVVTSSPLNQSVGTGEMVTFSVVARGDETTVFSGAAPNTAPDYTVIGNADDGLNYQWFNGDPTNGGTSIGGETTSSITLAASTENFGSTFCVVITHDDNECVEVVECAMLDLLCPSDPIVSIGEVQCVDGSTYNYSFAATDGSTVESTDGTINGNVVTVSVGTNDTLLVYNDINCDTLSLSVISPATCDNIECEQPDLTIGNSVCSGSTYSVAFTETTGATITSSAGTVGMNMITGIPVGSSATITATNPSDGACVAMISTFSPADCNEPCVEELVSVAALGTCAEDGDTYSVNFVLSAGAVLTTNPAVGTIGTSSISNIPAGTDIQLIATNSSCNSVDSILVNAPTCCGSLELKVFLQGPYNESSGLMNTTVNFYHLLPGQDPANSSDPAAAFFGVATSTGQPYNTAPWNYTGSEGDLLGDISNNTQATTTYPSNIVDWVLVSVRATDSLATSEVWKCAGLLESDGDVQFNDTCPCLELESNENYYVVVEHRNHLPIMSQVLQPTNNALEIDFTTQNSWLFQPSPGLFFGNGQLEMNGVFMMYAGNGQVTTRTAENGILSDDRNLWDLNQNSRFLYLQSDHNLNGSALSDDRVIWDLNQNVRTFINW